MKMQRPSLKQLGEQRRHLSREEFLARFPNPTLVQRVELPGESASPVPGSPSNRQTVMISLGLKRLRMGDADLATHPISRRQSTARGPITLGRDADCDIVIDVAAISRVHATFSVSADGTTTVRDVGSSFGTRVNGRKLAPQEEAVLQDCAVLSFADAVELTYYTPIGLYTILGLFGYAAG